MTGTDMNKKTELLAPAGTLDICKAVINAGADAVYLGGHMFGARAFAGNLEEEEILEALDYAHARSANIYLTLNTLLEEKELKKAYDFLKPLYLSGLDAVIVQDFGVLKMVRECFPDLHVHASTQMAVMGKDFAKYLGEYGVNRVVLPREFTLEEVREFASFTDIELEAFVHGALCYCYSGQCMLSATRGKRSGNRGTCAQPCRFEYELSGKRGRFLSAKDIATIEHLPEIADAGIYSFKIEGRMKNVNYAAGVTSIYRRYMDKYLAGEDYRVDPQDLNDLLDLYNRGGFSKGFFMEEKGKNLIEFKRPNHKGTDALKVLENVKGRITFEALEVIHKGDVFETGPESSFTSGSDLEPGERLEVNLPASLGLKKGQIIYRVNNAALQSFIAETYVDSGKKIGIDMECICRKGEPARLTVTHTASGVSATVEGETVQEALKASVSPQDIRQRLLKLGDTDFEAGEVKVEAGDGIFISNGGINRLRRDALDEIILQIRKKCVQMRQCFDYVGNDDIMGGSMFNMRKLNVSVCSIEQLCEVQNADGVSRIYVPYNLFFEAADKGIISECRNAGKEIFISLPYIMTEENSGLLKGFMSELTEDDADGIMVRSLDEALCVGAMKRSGTYCGPLRTVTDYNVYTYNHKAMEFVKEALEGAGLKFESFTLPVEPETENLSDIPYIGSRQQLAYGRIVAMRTKHCVRRNTKGCDRAFGTETLVYGKDRYPVMCFCDYCINVVFDSRMTDIIDEVNVPEKACADCLRLDFTTEDSAKVREVLGRL